MLVDHDFHPDEPTVRVFRTMPAGVLRLDDDVAVYEARYDDVVLRHYAFAHHWFKVNVTFDVTGELVETGVPDTMFSFNCDMATPMERDGDAIFGVDLFTDVLIRRDATTFVVTDEDELAAAVSDRLVSRREAAGANDGLAELLALIESRRLVPWLEEIVPFGPSTAPPAVDMVREAVPDRLRAGVRSTWSN